MLLSKQQKILSPHQFIIELISNICSYEMKVIHSDFYAPLPPKCDGCNTYTIWGKEMILAPPKYLSNFSLTDKLYLSKVWYLVVMWCYLKNREIALAWNDEGRGGGGGGWGWAGGASVGVLMTLLGMFLRQTLRIE